MNNTTMPTYSDFESMAQVFVDSPFLSWTVGPIVASFVGWSLSCVLLEWVCSQKWAQQYMISYGGEPRAEAIKDTHKVVSWSTQLYRTLMFVGGPYTMIGFAINALVFPLWIPQAKTAVPTATEFLWDFAKLMVAADFFLYWAHRFAHEIPMLWQHHKVHHLITTPSAVATAYIATVDAFVHAGPPMTLCALVAMPHPMAYTAYIFYHLASAAHNHSGLDMPLINFFMMKAMPLRTANAHHDIHHKFSNCGDGAKNYGDTFWVWDWMFGSMDSRLADEVGSKSVKKD